MYRADYCLKHFKLVYLYLAVPEADCGGDEGECEVAEDTDEGDVPDGEEA